MTDLRVVGGELVPPAPRERRHLLSIADLDRDDVDRLLATAASFALSQARETKKLPTLRGRFVLNVFYENSTRTSSSFDLAAKRLSADTMTVKASGSSVEKGESLRDTAQTLGAYGPDVIVIRHPEAGAAEFVARVTDAHVVNAGDGKHQHPTQALLDLYTMKEALGRLEGLHVAIVGDVLHSRVARSNVLLLSTLGARVTLVAPPTLLPVGVEAWPAATSFDLDGVLATSDVVMMLRVQRERMSASLPEGARDLGNQFVPSAREYARRYGLDARRMAMLDGDAIVMHPGPMNRGMEIAAEVADDPKRSTIVEQVTNGVSVRMAVLYLLLGGAE